MTIYRWFPAKGYAQYEGKTESDERKISWFNDVIGDPLPPLEKWSAPLLTQYLGDGRKKRKPCHIGDSPNAGMVGLISQRARDALDDIWSQGVLLYPVRLEDSEEPFYMVVAKNEIDCLIRDRSVGKKQKYGPTPDLFAVVENWEFDESVLGGNEIFILPDSSTTIYVTENFKQRVIGAGLKGFCLKRSFWEESPFIS